MIKLNFGCGDNLLPGWQNFDIEPKPGAKKLDISVKLPFADNYADYILCEHCVEHIPYKNAIDFFIECHRVLKPGGAVRIIVPSLEKIRYSQDYEYFKFTTKWQDQGASVRGAMKAILYAHGHEAAWTESLLLATLFYAGFNDPISPGSQCSEHEALRNIDGHARVIGDRFNKIESCVGEAVK